MKKSFIFIVYLIVSILLCPKVSALTLENFGEWNHEWNVNNKDYYKVIEPSKDGGFIMLCYYYEIESFKLVKYDKDKNITLEKIYTTNELPNYNLGIKENKNGKILIYGSDYEVIDNDVYEYINIMQISENGDIDFKESIGKNEKNDYSIINLTVSSDGKYIINGYAYKTFDINPVPRSLVTEYVNFIAKYDGTTREFYKEYTYDNTYNKFTNDTNVEFVSIHSMSDGTLIVEANYYDEDVDRCIYGFFKLDSQGEFKDEYVIFKEEYITYNPYIDKNDNLIIFISNNNYYSDNIGPLILTSNNSNDDDNNDDYETYSKVIKYDKQGNKILDENLYFYNNGGYLYYIDSVFDINNDEYLLLEDNYSIENNDGKFYINKIKINENNFTLERINDIYFDESFIYDCSEKIFDSKKIYFNTYSDGLYSLDIKHDVKVNDGIKNGDISLSNNKGEFGDEVTVTSTPELGYELDKILVNGKQIDDDNFKIKGDDEVKVTFKPIKYKFINGMNSKYKGEELEFKLDGEFSLFDKLYINGVELDPSYYDVRSGSTIITLKKDYLNELDDGVYNIRATYTTGVEDATIFTVGNVLPVSGNPKTGDNIMIYILIGLMSAIGISGTTLYNKKCKVQ